MSLLKFLFTEKCPQCGERIEKAAKFCRRCGAGRAESWRQCTACGVSVAADSQFCWSCNANVAAQPRDQIFSDRWRRTPGIFATRATIETPQDRLRNGIQVDDGTRGALFKDGVLKVELAPGYHTQTSFLERLTGGGKSGSFVEAVIAVSDPISSFVSLGESAALYSKDYAAVEAAVLVKLQLADFGVFTRRMLPTGTDTLRDDDVMLPLTGRVAEVLRRHVSRLGVNDIARSTELRHEMEAALGAQLPALLLDYGLTFLGVEDVRLDSQEISRVREAEGDLARAEREQSWEKLRREMEQTSKLDSIKDEFAYTEQIERWGHDLNLTRIERDHVMNMQQSARAHLRDIQDLKQKREREELIRQAALANLKGQEDELAVIRNMQGKGLELLMKMKRDKLALETEFEQKKAEHAVEIERRRIEVLNNAKPHVVAAVLPAEKGNQVIRALEMLRPLREEVVVISSTQMYGPGYSAPQPSFMPSYMSSQRNPGEVQQPAMPFVGSNLEVLAQRYLPSVGVVVAGVETGNPIPLGTAWIAAGHGVVITNAHVAEGVTEAEAQTGMDSWVIFSGQTQPSKVRRVLIHPDYAQSETKGYPIPSGDVAVLELETPPPPQAGLPMASRVKLLTLRELQSVAYLGFPMEHLAGGGTNLERPKAIAKKGVISSMEDWFMRHTDDPAQRQLIKHDLGVAGGASGSPMFDESGDVVGIICAGNMEQLYDPQSKRMRRTPNGVLLNFAQRIDVLLEWMRWG